MKQHYFTENDLASANEQAIRAAERTKTIGEVLELLVDKHCPSCENNPEEYVGDACYQEYNERNAELRAKLEAMKGSDVK